MLKTSSKIFRMITLSMQIIAMLAFYLPALINGGLTDIGWLVIGVVQTVLFCAVFFRDSKSRVGLSIAMMVINTLLSFVMFLIIGFFALIFLELGPNISAGLIYAVCALIAAVFSLCFPRKYINAPQEPVAYVQPPYGQPPQTPYAPIPYPQNDNTSNLTT